jgi:hypothetical protein
VRCVLKAGKKLHALAVRYPESSEPLAQGAFEWSTPPIRSGGSKAVEWARKTWVDDTQSAADSSMFSSTGFWTSPFTPKALFCAGVFLSYSLICKACAPYKLVADIFIAFACLSSAVTLRIDGPRFAKWCWGICMTISAVFYALAAQEKSSYYGGLGPALQSIGRSTVCASLASLTMIPRHTFEIVFILVPTLMVLSGIDEATHGRHALDSTNTTISTFFAGVSGLAIPSAAIASSGAFIWTGRSHAKARAQKLSADIAKDYTVLWEKLLAQDGFRDSLSSLNDAWDCVQGGAQGLKVKKQSAKTLYKLLCEADQINDLLQAKLYDLCTVHGGTLHGSPVKTESRALQKVFRTYCGDWSKLCDLCRASIVFTSIADLEKYLRAMGDDSELEIVKAPDDTKMRLRENFDAAKYTGGYRDIQLCVRLTNVEARERCVAGHLCEVQLHFADIMQLKSEGGHRNYIECRNLRGD